MKQNFQSEMNCNNTLKRLEKISPCSRTLISTKHIAGEVPEKEKIQILMIFENNKCWRGCGEMKPLCNVDGNVWKRVCEFFKILKTELPQDPASPLLGMYSKI